MTAEARRHPRRVCRAALGLVLASAGCAGARLQVEPAVVVGGTESCALTSEGRAFCWGMRIGDRAPAQPVRSPEAMRSLGFGVFRACGLSRRSAPLCTGNVIVADSVDDCGVVVCLGPLPEVRARYAMLAVGYYHTCALDGDGRAWCWGYNSMGQLGDGRRQPHLGSLGVMLATPQPVAGGHRFVSISAGETHTCGLTATGEAWCWGYGQSGEIGRDTVMTYCAGAPPQTNATCSVDVPVRVTGDVRFRTIAAGFRMTCAIGVDDSAYCWGSNYRCGLGTCGRDSPTPVRIALPAPVRQVAPGYWFACAVLTDDRALCWGHNNYGQLGSTVTADSTVCFGGGRCSPSPTEVSGGHRWRMLSAGELHACGVTRGDKVYCWGASESGRLADGGAPALCSNRGSGWPDKPCSATPILIVRPRAGAARGS